MEELRQRLDRERTARTGDLHHQQHHGHSLADIAERHGQRIHDIREHERGKPPHGKELQRMIRLHAKEIRVTQANQCALQQREQCEDRVPSEILVVEAQSPT